MTGTWDAAAKAPRVYRRWEKLGIIDDTRASDDELLVKLHERANNCRQWGFHMLADRLEDMIFEIRHYEGSKHG